MSQTPSGSPGAPEGPESIWGQPRFVLAAAVTALIAVVALVLVVLGPPGHGATNAAPTTAGASTATATTQATVDTGASICGLPAGDQTVPQTAPDTTWVLVGRVAAPNAPKTIGPGIVRQGLRSCYARSPLGALYASAGFLASTSVSTLRIRTVQELAAEGVGRTQTLKSLRGHTADSAQDEPGAQIAGFSFLNYDRTSTVIDLAIQLDGKDVHLPVSVRWQDGDWKILLPTTGDLYDAIQPIPDLTGYIPWAGA